LTGDGLDTYLLDPHTRSPLTGLLTSHGGSQPPRSQKMFLKLNISKTEVSLIFFRLLFE
jgi:hypothetical protein